MESGLAKFISEIAYVLTLFLNSVLIYLTAYCTKRISRTYRQMIIGFAMIGMVFSTFDLVVRPIMHSYNGCFLYFSLEGLFRSSKPFTEVLLAIYSAIYSIILSFLTIQYLFRTCLLISPHLTIYFRGWRFLIWLGYVAFFGVTWGYITYVHAYPDDYARDYVRQELYQHYGVNADNVPLFAMLAYQESNGQKRVRFQSLVCIFGQMGIISVQYVIMISCGVVMWRKIRKDLRVTSSATASRVQKQFFKALVWQLAAPSLLVHLPAVPLFFAPFFDMKISFRSRIVVHFFSFYPLFDSLILFCVVTDYKMAIRRIVSRLASFVLTLMHSPTMTTTETNTTPDHREDVL